MDDEMREDWKTLSNYPDYEVSSLGRVRRVTPTTARPNGGLLKQHAHHRCGYMNVRVSTGGVPKNKLVHDLVAQEFLGVRPDGFHINHIDGDKANNAAGNLEYVTPLANVHHAYSLGLKTRPIGINNPKSKLTDESARDIRQNSSLPTSHFMEKYGVSKATVDRIKRGAAWAHV